MSYFQYDRSGRSLGVAYVQFSNPRDAKLALDRLNGVVAKGESFESALGRWVWGIGGQADDEMMMLTTHCPFVA